VTDQSEGIAPQITQLRAAGVYVVGVGVTSQMSDSDLRAELNPIISNTTELETVASYSQLTSIGNILQGYTCLPALPIPPGKDFWRD